VIVAHLDLDAFFAAVEELVYEWMRRRVILVC
jgi:nucleotidyltransferase/DNA polymerase involved in DNA repair